jgi:hypothetical protein
MNKPIGFIRFLNEVLHVSLEAGQRVFWSVAGDGVQPEALSLPDRAIARELFGDVNTIDPNARKVVAAVKGARIGFTYIVALRFVYRCLTADLRKAAPGEIRWCLAIAPDLELASRIVEYAKGAVESVPSLASLVQSTSGDSILLKRPDGRLVGIKTRAAGVGGKGGRSNTWIEACLDESAFFRDKESGAINDEDVYRAVAARVQDGTIWIGSTPWAKAGLLYDQFTRNWAEPKTALAANLPTSAMRSDPDILTMVARERLRDPDNAAREYDCAFLDVGAGQFFPGDLITEAVDDTLSLPLPRPLEPVSIAIDLGFVNDASALVAATKSHDGKVMILDVVELRPSKGNPLKPSEVIATFAEVAKRYGVSSLISDVHHRESIREHLTAHNIDLTPAPEGRTGKNEAHVMARTMLREGRLVLPSHERLLRQLREVSSKALPGGGLHIYSPRRVGSHGDLASALCTVVHAIDSTTSYYDSDDFRSAPGRWGDSERREYR